MASNSMKQKAMLVTKHDYTVDASDQPGSRCVTCGGPWNYVAHIYDPLEIGAALVALGRAW